MEADDEQVTRWALAAGRGDNGAATAFVAATRPQVRRFLTRLAGHGDAEDLTQETYLRALGSLPGFGGRSSARTWLFSIARRVAVDRVRAALARPRTVPREDWEAEPGAAAGGRFENEVLIRRLVAGLAPERREAFVATQLLGLSYEEAAELCGCPIGTIRSRVARAREDLVTALTATGHRRAG